ncbi:CehA/McbA family metallohydrolase [Undibacterium cyanobacteriorum]|uniref:CehA/McbA family metallohydrolase n=1 Tax=Undibacterium cyanobacteriorum TaxID=3073561 RepID=A0ABY9RIP1_9BURK|nr:CehA/McbA family metallohydrolase [Undibacterium sp. 20NA77.5]WMW80535.1 CehA/McbA family metallohydrolase [Undibacterium sp. 20NA77.5]
MSYLKNIRRQPGAWRLSAICLATVSTLGMSSLSNLSFAGVVDHHEFEASVHVPYRAPATARVGDESRTFTLDFSFPLNKAEQTVAWKLDLVAPSGRVVQTWNGTEKLLSRAVIKQVYWAGRNSANAMPDGIYQLRLTAAAVDTREVINPNRRSVNQVVNEILLQNRAEIIEQSWPMQVGSTNQVAMPAFAGLKTAKNNRTMSAPPALAASSSTSKTAMAPAVPATSSLPYTVYYGNLHSQTNHSDGGGNLSACTGAQNPQSAAYGPSDAYQYAMNKGLDFLMTSEHNHMYDGSDATNTSANPTTAKNLYQSGLSAATSFNASNPNFLAIYGLEWGVINNGGHLNIFNSNELLGWEYNASNQLIADTLTVKNDYAALYTLMRQRGWIGQFNHPSSSGQFLVNGVPLAYTADGDQAMVACEILNTSAFSTNTTESETGRSTYESACNKALEAGFHIAFTTNQDNHCANWGASYTNRNGVLIPSGLPLTNANFIAALRARRVFATMDKNSQLVLTANGHIMGERFSNSGSLTLTTNFANSAGRTASTVQIFEGVPGRNGTVTQLSNTAITTITPSAGEHFYYAKVTQDDGNILWSAPIWVSQGTASSDTTTPTVSASETGTSGTITLNATASDNVGVSKVEFYVDSVLKGTATAAPYSLSLNSTTLSNGTHTYVAKAYDAAGNIGSSSAVSFSINNPVPDTTAPSVTASESGTSGTISFSATASDNVGVSKVEFYVDATLKATVTAAPYTTSLNSTTLTNGSHSLVAKAYDAAGNVGTSSTVTFSVNNTVSKQLIVNGGFESGASSWTATAGVISNDTTQAARAGTYKAWLNGYGASHVDSIYQTISIPSTSTSTTLSFWLKVVSNETTTTQAYDTLQVQIRNSSGTVLSTLATYSNLNKGTTYVNKSFDISSYKGQTIRIYFLGTEGSVTATSFLIDDVSVVTQ